MGSFFAAIKNFFSKIFGRKKKKVVARKPRPKKVSFTKRKPKSKPKIVLKPDLEPDFVEEDDEVEVNPDGEDDYDLEVPKTSGKPVKYVGKKNLVIEFVNVTSSPEHGLEIVDCENIVVRGATIKNCKESGIYIEGSNKVTIVDCDISNVITGVNAVRSKGIKVSYTNFKNMKGPIPAGQYVQFNNVTGSGNLIDHNYGVNQPGKGIPEDAISLYQSSGTKSSPIKVSNNLFIGGGPSESGGGIMLGDDGGAYQVAENNVLVDPGQYGIAVSGGHDMKIIGNTVYGKKQKWTNVGIYAWDQSERGQGCYNVSVRNNKVWWKNHSGRDNPFWDGENVKNLTGEVDGGNDWEAKLDPVKLKVKGSRGKR